MMGGTRIRLIRDQELKKQFGHNCKHGLGLCTRVNVSSCDAFDTTIVTHLDMVVSHDSVIH